MDNLESVEVETCDEKSLRSLILSAPKLKEFHTESCIARRETVDEFLAHNPQLEILELNDIGGPSRERHHLERCQSINFNRFKEFWHLKSLTTLILDSGTLKKPGLIIDFERIASSFPLLTRLELSCVSVDGDQISHLASMKNMAEIEIFNIPPQPDHRFVENALLDLATNYKQLIRASFPLTKMSFETFLAFVSNNPHLNNMTMDRFTECITTQKSAIDMLRSLVANMKTNPFFLTIKTHGNSCYDDWSHKHFQSEDVEDFLRELKEKDGIRLVVSLPKFSRI